MNTQKQVAETITAKRRFELMDIVGRLNNHPANILQDHLTFTGFFTTEAEFAAHIAKLEKYADEYAKDL